VKFVQTHLLCRFRLWMGFWVDWWNLWRRSSLCMKFGACRMKEMDIKVYLGSFISFYVMWKCYDNIGCFYPVNSFPGMSWMGLEFAMWRPMVIITPILKRRPFLFLHAKCWGCIGAFIWLAQIILGLLVVGGDRRCGWLTFWRLFGVQ